MRALTTLVALSCLVICAPMADAADDWQSVFQPDAPVRGGSFTLDTGEGILVEPAVSDGASTTRTLAGAHYRFPVTSGQRTPKDIAQLARATWRFDGALTWKRGNRKFRVDRLRVTTDSRSLTARVSGRRTRIGTLNEDWLADPRVRRQARGYWPRLSRGTITLSSRFRMKMKSRLGRTPERRIRGSIALAIPLRFIRDD